MHIMCFDEHCALLVLYFDDVIITGSSGDTICEVADKLKNRFEMV